MVSFYPASMPTVPWWISPACSFTRGTTLSLLWHVEVALASYSQPEGRFSLETFYCPLRVVADFKSPLFLHDSSNYVKKSDKFWLLFQARSASRIVLLPVYCLYSTHTTDFRPTFCLLSVRRTGQAPIAESLVKEPVYHIHWHEHCHWMFMPMGLRR
jgi:hypothetical protein